MGVCLHGYLPIIEHEGGCSLGAMSHLVLIDGHHLMYRAYWAIPRTLRTRAGLQVNAVFGMVSMLLAILKQESPDALLLCFDAGEETFRHQEHAAYKEGRPDTPEDFYQQIPLITEVVDAFGFPRVADPTYEADDFLGAYALAGERAGMRVSVVTGDRDALQLASDAVRIIIPHKGYREAEVLGPEEVRKKYGVRPDQIPAWKGLAGDLSDNLPGVHGIGPKGAAKLLQQFGTLEALYSRLSAVPPTLRQKLAEGREQAFFCQRMAQLVRDIPLPLPLDALFLRALPSARILATLQQFEFTLLLRRFRELLATPYGSRVFQEFRMGREQQLSLF